MRRLRTDKTAQVIIAGHAFVQNLHRGHYELAIDAPPAAGRRGVHRTRASDLSSPDISGAGELERWHTRSTP
jgi:hypothetical protein